MPVTAEASTMFVEFHSPHHPDLVNGDVDVLSHEDMEGEES